MPKPPRVRSHRNARDLLYQAALVGLLVALLAWLFDNTLANMRMRGIQSGFDFLNDLAGFDIGESLLDYDSGQPYWRAFAVGLLNTLRVAVVGVIGCTVLGLVAGIGRLSSNALARGLAGIYVEVLRNVPLLLQLFLWYVLLVEAMPEGDAPLRLLDLFFLDKNGLAMPSLVWSDSHRLLWNVPLWQDGQVQGGVTLTPEFLALAWGLTLYTSAFVAELVRAGVNAVPRGQTEAAQSLGMTRAQTLRWIVLPQALRVIVPPLTNQYLNLTKNSSLAVAIGYPDLVNIANTALNQTGRAVECIALIMAVYLALSLLTSAAMNVYNRRLMRSTRA